MIKALGYLFVAAVLLYFLFYPWLRHSVNRKKIFKWFIIVYGLAMLVSAISTYVIGSGVPASFTAGVEILKRRSDIKDRIGDIEEVKYDKKELPGAADDTAQLKFELQGSEGVILIEGTVTKNRKGNWHWVKIKKDSLLETY